MRDGIKKLKASDFSHFDYGMMFFNSDDAEIFTKEQMEIIGESIRDTLSNCLFDSNLEVNLEDGNGLVSVSLFD